MENLNDIIFYTIERSIKSYRQYAQRQINAAGFSITIDQWLILKAIEEDNTIPQQQIAEKVFKDVASITRIIEILVRKGYLSREFNTADRRRFILKLTANGQEVLEKLQPYVNANRDKALQGVSQGDINLLQEILLKITTNVS